MKKLIFIIPVIVSCALIYLGISNRNSISNIHSFKSYSREAVQDYIARSAFSIATARDNHAGELSAEMFQAAESDLAQARDLAEKKEYRAAGTSALRSLREAAAADDIARTAWSLHLAALDIKKITKPRSALNKLMVIKFSQASVFFDLREYAQSEDVSCGIISTLHRAHRTIFMRDYSVAEASVSPTLSKQEIDELKKDNTVVIFDERSPEPGQSLTLTDASKAYVDKVNTEIKKYESTPEYARAGTGSSAVQNTTEIAATNEELPTTHKVLPHECLWTISGSPQIYHRPWQWPVIYHANESNIKDPNLIYDDQVLDIPRNVTDEVSQQAHKEASDTYYAPTDGPRQANVRPSTVRTRSRTTGSSENTTTTTETQTPDQTNAQPETRRTSVWKVIMIIFMILAILAVVTIMLIRHSNRKESDKLY